ncbi:MAG: hypothetical protein GF353_29005 [Candidatus Lokiarchaeota archaeon]|nr:hypothetical protein [Candidatus Lokiarchaeota archaeon]
MKKIVILIALFPFILSAQEESQNNSLTEDRVKVIVNEQAEKIEKRINDNQTAQLNLHKKELTQNAQQINQKIDLITSLGSVIVVLFGSGLFLNFRRRIKKANINVIQKFEKEIEEAKFKLIQRFEEEVGFAIYKLDPRKWKIYIPRKDFDAERQRLEGLKYLHLESYEGLDVNLREGIIVYRAYSDDDIVRLKRVLVEQEVNSLKSCIVIYYTGKERLNTEILQSFDNFVLSNMPGTLSSQIFAASRNIVHDV